MQRVRFSRDQFFVLAGVNAHRIPASHHLSRAALSHHLGTYMRLTAASSTERLLTQDHRVLVVHSGFRNKEPLALPDCLPPLNLRGAQTGNRRSYIVNSVARHGRNKPMAFIFRSEPCCAGYGERRGVPSRLSDGRLFLTIIERPSPAMDFFTVPILTFGVLYCFFEVPATQFRFHYWHFCGHRCAETWQSVRAHPSFRAD